MRDFFAKQSFLRSRHCESEVFKIKNQKVRMTDGKYRHPERSVESKFFNLSRVAKRSISIIAKTNYLLRFFGRFLVYIQININCNLRMTNSNHQLYSFQIIKKVCHTERSEVSPLKQLINNRKREILRLTNHLILNS